VPVWLGGARVIGLSGDHDFTLGWLLSRRWSRSRCTPCRGGMKEISEELGVPLVG